MSKQNKVYRVALGKYGDSYVITVEREHSKHNYFTKLGHACKVAVLASKVAQKRGWTSYLYDNGWSIVNWQRFDKVWKKA